MRDPVSRKVSVWGALFLDTMLIFREASKGFYLGRKFLSAVPTKRGFYTLIEQSNMEPKKGVLSSLFYDGFLRSMLSCKKVGVSIVAIFNQKAFWTRG